MPGESLLGKAIIREEEVIFPTYGVGEPDHNPMFFERRVYQGSSGRIYPYPLIETVSDEKKDVAWRAIILENEYIKVMILPELGGRIHMALDKTNGYHFVYFNRVIKPALVGLAGPWISGGIEFNWPQHHRPSTFQPVDCTTRENPDGSVTAWLGEIEHLSRLRGVVGITLRPGVARIDIEGVSHNRTLLPQTMLWWANPAVAVNDDYQSVFPPDVQAVMDHGKRDVSRFPIAVGTYYNQDYSHGVDISWYKNIPVPSSYMVAQSNYDFCGGYDHGKRAGILHVADHHVSPGKKQWTWGNGDFGRVWTDHLTDEDGPYIELMTGVFTDNQPDFSWLQPGETKRFQQHFFPCREIGVTRQANKEAALSLEIGKGLARLGLYATSAINDARILLEVHGTPILEKTIRLSPDKPFVEEVVIDEGCGAHEVRLSLHHHDGLEIIAWSPEPPRDVSIPESAKPAPQPHEMKTNEELYLTGLHLEQYRHASRDPEPYYREALRRDEGDARCNNAIGLLLLRRGDLVAAVPSFERAIQRLTLRNGNPYDGETHYNLGVALELMRDLDGAYDVYGKAAWNESWQVPAWCGMARIDVIRGHWAKGLQHIESGLSRGARNLRARHLKSILLRCSDNVTDAAALNAETLELDPLEPSALYESVILACRNGEQSSLLQYREEFSRLTRGHVQSLIELALDYAACGQLEAAIELLQHEHAEVATSPYPMALYLLCAFCHRAGRVDEADRWQKLACKAPPDCCFPHRIEEALALEEIIDAYPQDARALYYLGNQRYDARRHDEAISCWERSRDFDPTFPTTHRNLALAYHNKRGDSVAALEALRTAFVLNPSDARVLFELDQLLKKVNMALEARLELLSSHAHLLAQRDGLYLELVSLHNRLGRHKEALDLLAARHFHPWEGGEGRVAEQYQFAQVQLAKMAIADGRSDVALDHLRAATCWPRNLGEGRLTGIRENHIEYFTALALEMQGQMDEARRMLEKAASGFEHTAMSMYYNDQPPDMLYYQGLALARLGKEKEAASRFNRLIDHGERHLNDLCEIDYFAVSLPNFLVFDDDLNLRNRVHCLYLMALGHAGKGNTSVAHEMSRQILELDANHLGAFALLSETELKGPKV